MSIQALTYVLEHCEATGVDRNLMFAIANHANEHGENCWASVATLAHESRCSVRAAKYGLKRLRGEPDEQERIHYAPPLLERYGRSPAGTNFYRILALSDRENQLPLLAERGSAASAPPVQDVHQGSADSCTPGVQTSAPKPLGTVLEPTTPLTPQKRGERSRSHRKRDQDRDRAEREAWAAEHFPAYDPRAVLHAAEFAVRRAPELAAAGVTAEAVAAELERRKIEPISGVAA